MGLLQRRLLLVAILGLIVTSPSCHPEPGEDVRIVASLDYVTQVTSLTAEPPSAQPGERVTLRWESAPLTLTVRLTRGDCPDRAVSGPVYYTKCPDEVTLASDLPPSGSIPALVEGATTFWMFPAQTTIPVFEARGRGIRVASP
jgi:hypothetical protein